MDNLLKLPSGGNPKPMFKRPKAGFRLLGSTEPRTVCGQVARSLVALHRADGKGVTALELSSWALRLAHYVMELRRLGLDIEMIREDHPGGWHGRYVLRTPIELVFTEGC